MKKLVFPSALILCALFSTHFAQSKKKKTADPPTVRAEVTVKIDLPAPTSAPDEDAAGVWNDFVSEKYGFRVTFPAQSKDVFDDETGKIAIFQASTRQAEYGLAVKSLLVSLNNSQLDALYESVINATEDLRTTRLVAKRNVYLDGFLGKEIVYEENGKIVFGRMYILESKLFMLSVSLPKKGYTKDFDRWTLKFFDSFGVRSGAKRDSE